MVLARPAKLCNFVDWKVRCCCSMNAVKLLQRSYAACAAVPCPCCPRCNAIMPPAPIVAGCRIMLILCCPLPLPPLYLPYRTRRLCTSGTPPCTSSPALTRVRWWASGRAGSDCMSAPAAGLRRMQLTGLQTLRSWIELAILDVGSSVAVLSCRVQGGISSCCRLLNCACLLHRVAVVLLAFCRRRQRVADAGNHPPVCGGAHTAMSAL